MPKKPAGEEPEEQPAAEPAAEPAIYYANSDRTKIVPAGSPEAAFSFPASEPGQFEELLAKHRASDRKGK